MCNPPCKECPWLKASIPGWLGASTPLEFLALSESEARMPCHLTVDYEREDWNEQVEEAPQCAGRSIHFANRCRIPRSKEILRAKPDHENVFSNPVEFYKHHGGKNEIQIIGCRVVEVDD